MKNAVVVRSRDLGTPRPVRRGPLNPRYGGWLLAAALVVTFLAGRALWTEVVDDVQRAPLRAIEEASSNSGRSIGVVDPTVASSWSSSSESAPTEAELRRLLGPGNAYLEPAFYARDRRGFLPEPEARCYFIAVQRGAVFDADRVKSLMRLCYLGSGAMPNSTSSRAATG